MQHAASRSVLLSRRCAGAPRTPNPGDVLVIRIRSSAFAGALALAPLLVLAQKPATSKATPRTSALPLKYRAKPTTAAISPGDLMSRLYVFADDSMLGREAGTPGHMKGTKYIAAELKRLGLTPAGDSGTYFQDVPFVARYVSGNTSLSSDNKLFNINADFVALPFRGARARELNGIVPVFGGVWGDTTRAITAEQANGKFVVLIAPNGLGRLPANSPLSGAAGIGLVADAMLTEQQRAQGRAPALTLLPTADAPAVAATLVMTNTMAQMILGAPLEGMVVGKEGHRLIGNLIYELKPAPTRNVVAVLRGSDPVLANQYVAIGAHSDHIGYRVGGAVEHDSLHALNAQRFFINDNPSGTPLTADQRAARDARLAGIHVDIESLRAARPARRDSINNGADDDGSGTVTVLEVAEAFAKGRMKPKRSLLFVWHTGEEKGLLGSRYFTDHPTVPRDSIVAQLNIDMVGRGAARDLPAGGDNYLQLVGSRRLSTELGDLVERYGLPEGAEPRSYDGHQFEDFEHYVEVQVWSNDVLEAAYPGVARARH